MARYISLLRFTDQGAKNIKDSTKRALAFDKAAEEAGIKIVGQYWTIGAYDGVLIVEADSSQKALHWVALLAADGNVKPETLEAFQAKEFEQIVK